MGSIKGIAALLDSILKRIVTISAGISAAIVFVMMFPITFDVILRYGFNRPLHGTYQLAEFMMVGTVYLALAFVQRHREHIKLEVATDRLHPRIRHIMDIFGLCVGIAIFTVIAWQSGLEAYKTWRIGDYTMGLVEWPLWPAKASVAYGSWLLVLQLISDVIRDIARYPEIEEDREDRLIQKEASC